MLDTAANLTSDTCCKFMPHMYLQPNCRTSSDGDQAQFSIIRGGEAIPPFDVIDEHELRCSANLIKLVPVTCDTELTSPYMPCPKSPFIRWTLNVTAERSRRMSPSRPTCSARIADADTPQVDSRSGEGGAGRNGISRTPCSTRPATGRRWRDGRRLPVISQPFHRLRRRN